MTKLASEVIASIEKILDTFYRTDYKFFEPQIYALLNSGYKVSDASAAYDYYQPLLEEVKQKGEGYEYLTKKQHKSYIAFLTQIVEDCRLFSKNQRKKPTRKPRFKSAQKLTTKVRYLAEYPEWKLVSVAPSELVNSTWAWLFNVHYRRLTYLVAKPNQSLTVSGTTIVNYDEERSIVKVVRKPEMIVQWLSLARNAMKQEFDKLKTRPSKANGRINRDVLILRVGH